MGSAPRRQASPATAVARPLVLLFATTLFCRAAAYGGYAEGMTDLQKHAAFFDSNGDGIVSISETYDAFRALGFGVGMSSVSAAFINGALASKTRPEVRIPLHIRVSQKCSTVLSEEGTLPLSIDQLEIFWREKDEDSEWTKANDNTDLEEGYDSSKDEASSVSSYNPSKANPEFSLRNSLSTQSLSSRLSTSEPLYSQVEQPNFPSYSPIPRLSVSEISDDHYGGLASPQRKLTRLLSDPPSNGQRFSPDSDHQKDDVGLPPTPKHVEPAGSEGFTRGRSYNIRIDDQVLLRFSPKNSDSTYYFGDMIGAALTFFHGTGTRRCLEVSITLETSETINPRALHPSRRSSPTITKENATSSHLDIYIENIHKGIHGSDSGAYDAQGRFVPEKFDEIFARHARTVPGALTSDGIDELLQADRQPSDYQGWVGATSEWKILYSLAKDKDGLLRKDVARGVYDGSLFHQLVQKKRYGDK